MECVKEMGRSGSLRGGRPVVRESRRGRPVAGGGCDMEKNWLKGRFRRRSWYDLATAANFGQFWARYRENIVHTHLHVRNVPISTIAMTKNNHSNIDCDLAYRVSIA